jgi:hypothetical protein
VGYFEGLSFFERMEAGFNFYYGFREGETAWIYARTLSLFHHLLGIRAFALDPYQIGYQNEEGIASGAFWFYRKLGFRPVQPGLLRLTMAEERKLAASPGYRTPARTLRRLAQGSMLLTVPPAAYSDWDGFQVRNLGLAVERCMAARFHGDADSMRRAAIDFVERALGCATHHWSNAARTSLGNLALVLLLVPDLKQWSDEEKGAVERIVRAKAGADEARYLKALQRHKRLRTALIHLGS